MQDLFLRALMLYLFLKLITWRFRENPSRRRTIVRQFPQYSRL
jgi:hypothetical protein